MITLSQRLQQLQPSPTLAVTAKFKQMKAQGLDVIGFGAGEPDFDTPDHIKVACQKALFAGTTKYLPAAGSPQARNSVAQYYCHRHNHPYRSDNVLISCGGKHSLFIATLGLVDPGDEVVILAPYWVSYPEQVRLAGGKPVVVTATSDQGYKIKPQQLKEVLTEKTKAVILNSPGNPTGITYTRQELLEICQVILENSQATIFSDEIYDELTYEKESTHIATLLPELFERTLTFNGLSKTYAMTGWRIGFTLGPKAIIKKLASLQGQMTSNINSFAMAAISAALEGPRDPIEKMRQSFAQRADWTYKKLSSIPHLKVHRPTGAFYIFPDITHFLGGTTAQGTLIESSQDFANALLEEAMVAVVPGEGFGAPGCIRISFATSLEEIKKGLARMEKFLAEIQVAIRST